MVEQQEQHWENTAQDAQESYKLNRCSFSVDNRMLLIAGDGVGYCGRRDEHAARPVRAT